MVWWQFFLLVVGIWLFGFLTGTQAGISATLLRTGLQRHPNPQQPNPQDMAALMQMMGQQGPGRGQ